MSKSTARMLSAALMMAGVLSAGPVLAAPSVVASIKPIHSLVAAVMQGVGTPVLLVRGGASPHSYSLKPSDAAALEGAEIVFWTGHGLEVFLQDALDTLASRAEVVELAETAGLELLAPREGGAFEPHDDVHEGHEAHAHETGAQEAHDGEEADMHFWLDPDNAGKLVGTIAETLIATDPGNTAAYRANAEAEVQRLEALAAELEVTLAPVRDKPFIVFHDAYQYFERRFDLTLAGSITVSPEAAPGAARLSELQDKVKTLGATCVFAEPQFEPAVVSTIIEGTDARIGVLDPEGGALEEGPGLYPALLRGLAGALVQCLSGAAP